MHEISIKNHAKIGHHLSQIDVNIPGWANAESNGLGFVGVYDVPIGFSRPSE